MQQQQQQRQQQGEQRGGDAAAAAAAAAGRWEAALGAVELVRGPVRLDVEGAAVEDGDEAGARETTRRGSSACISPDGRVVVLARTTKAAIEAWSLETGKRLSVLTLEAAEKDALRCMRASRTLVVVGKKLGTTMVWPWSTSAESAAVTRLCVQDGGKYEDVVGVAVSSDETKAAAAVAKAVRVFDIATQAELHTLRTTEWALGVAFSPHDPEILVAGYEGKSTVRVWNANTGELRRVLNAGGMKPYTLSVAVSTHAATGSMLIAAGFFDKTVLWNVEPGGMVLQLTRPLRGSQVFFSQDGRLLLASAMERAELRVLRTRDGACVSEFVGPAISAVHFLSDRESILTFAAHGRSFCEWRSSRGIFQRATLALLGRPRSEGPAPPSTRQRMTPARFVGEVDGDHAVWSRVAGFFFRHWQGRT